MEGLNMADGIMMSESIASIESTTTSEEMKTEGIKGIKEIKEMGSVCWYKMASNIGSFFGQIVGQSNKLGPQICSYCSASINSVMQGSTWCSTCNSAWHSVYDSISRSIGNSISSSTCKLHISTKLFSSVKEIIDQIKWRNFFDVKIGIGTGIGKHQKRLNVKYLLYNETGTARGGDEEDSIEIREFYRRLGKRIVELSKENLKNDNLTIIDVSKFETTLNTDRQEFNNDRQK
ncbi:MAG: hypothetical protein HQK53_01310 [Oligoflexia bacterium]|nr:hypothetical protein [Oligoflexia bacterium]